MAAIKQKLADNDPGYISLPPNTHKVSNSPSLSTVTEESTPYSKRGVETPRTDPMTTIPGLMLHQPYIYYMYMLPDILETTQHLQMLVFGLF